ncbi:hypothetical protein [Nocardia stercoris]|uniref:Uncharacterized protein n=1 Tax=Nocardia stercoris TaxID=2483361 RepID=A0A3M2L799_9NOCA|nr:hypothetical protein [Nocardia stercoris]RMI31785.1 hypothetical protein EBN03_16480 [Nocardia stercoris]
MPHELWSRRIAVRYADGHLSTTPLQADDAVALEVPLHELRMVRLAPTDDGQLALLLFFRSPDQLAGGTATHYHPVPIHLDPELETQARELVRVIEGDLLTARRVQRSRPDHTPPPGPIRADVTAAADRIRSDDTVIRQIGALHHFARSDEYVLDVAPATYAGTAGLLAVTTLRLLFVSAGMCHEFPVSAIERTDATTTSGSEVKITVTAGPDVELEFTGTERDDLARLTRSVHLACEMEHVDGSVVPSRPTSADLFGQWQSLVERHELGMLSDDPFQHHATGILSAMPSQN